MAEPDPNHPRRVLVATLHIPAVNPNQMSLGPRSTIAVTFVRPVHLIIRRAPGSGTREKRLMDIVQQKTKCQGSPR
jgi:hypothetical protein